MPLLKMRIIRLVRGLSQFDLSIATKIPSYRLSTIENGKLSEPTFEELTRIADALQTKPDLLLEIVQKEKLMGYLSNSRKGRQVKP